MTLLETVGLYDAYRYMVGMILPNHVRERVRFGTREEHAAHQGLNRLTLHSIAGQPFNHAPTECSSAAMYSHDQGIMEAVISQHSLAVEHSRPIKSSLDAYISKSIARVAGAQASGIAQVCANLALEVCRAGSAGVSLLDPDNRESGFKWTALTGLVYDFPDGCSPRHDSACGTCVDSRQPLLFKNPARRFRWMMDLPVQVAELMAAPMYVRSGAPAGTIWVVHHASLDHFDASDMHYLETISSLMSKIII